MKVIIRTHASSDPFVFEEVRNAYTKDQMYCLRLEDKSTLKFPLVSIFSVKEENAYTSQKEA